MTLFSRLTRRLLGALGLALVCAIPATYALTAEAAELEGTVVTVEPVGEQGVEPGLPAEPVQPGISNTPPPPELMAEQARALKESERAMREAEHALHEQQNWSHEFDRGMQKAFEDDAVFNAGVLIPIFAVIFIFGGPIFLLAFWIAKRYSARSSRQQNLNQNIDKLLAAGRDIPVELLRGDDPIHEDDLGSRDKGIRNVFLGTGWLVFLTIMVGFDIGSAGFIWIALGASQVLIWYLNNPKNKPVDDQAAPQD